MINLISVRHLRAHLPEHEVEHLVYLAGKVDQVGRKWQTKLKTSNERIAAEIIESLEKNGRITDAARDKIEDILADIIMGNALDTAISAFKSARRMPGIPKRLAAFPKGRLPRSLKSLREMWDKWRNKRELLPRQNKIVKELKKKYIDKCQDVWSKYAEKYRAGKTQDKLYVVEKLTEAADTVHSRGKMIVETETTRYWNQTRRDFYDKAEDVTHYLFVPIRDMATTKWCKSRRGLIYAKGTAVLERETPPIHWNCRSEILPLTIMNPAHRKLIEDKSMWRANHKCEPLPPGWNS